MNIFNILIQSLVSEGDWMTLSDHPGLCGLSLVLYMGVCTACLV